MDEDEDGDAALGNPSESDILLTAEFTGFSRAQVRPSLCNQWIALFGRSTTGGQATI